DSDKDLTIRSLYDSIAIHKQLVEQSQNEREESADLYEGAQQLLKEQQQTIERLQKDNSQTIDELNTKRQEYKRMETNFYAHMCAIRATDDDLSTIQRKITNLFSQISNFCMGLRSQVDIDAGTSFVLKYWPRMEPWIREQWMDTNGKLSAAHITVFVEKFIAETLIHRIFDEPIQLGTSVNTAFAYIDKWMRARQKHDWSVRLRQQLTSLMVKQPMEESSNIKRAQANLADDIFEVLDQIYITVSDTSRAKLLSQIQKSCELALAVHGQEAIIRPYVIEEGVSQFQAELMKPNNKGKEDGVVYLVVSPPFVVDDPTPESGQECHGFIVQGKVVCF
ncbi:hypothetical protein DM01DRAFT_1276282, partial [Hesseltinella vesiculosa]